MTSTLDLRQLKPEEAGLHFLQFIKAHAMIPSLKERLLSKKCDDLFAPTFAKLSRAMVLEPR